MSLYGPFAVLNLTAAPSVATDAFGDTVTTYPLAAGVHYTADGPTWAANPAALTPYRVLPVHPLQFVMAGDDPANPVNSFAIVFPDQTTANTVIAQLV